MAKRVRSRDQKPPNPNRIADKIISLLPQREPGTLRIVVHGLVLMVFQSRTSVTLLLPKEGAPGSEHAAFGKAYDKSRGSRLKFSGAHWRLDGHRVPSDPVRRISSRTIDHPLVPVERVLDMLHVVGDIRLHPFRELVRRGLLDASFTVSGVTIRSEVPYAPLGWGVLWGTRGGEVLCTDTAILTVRTSGKVLFSGRSYDTQGDRSAIELTAGQRDVFIGNIDKVRCRTRKFELDETLGYVGMYPVASSKATIPFPSRTFLDRIPTDSSLKPSGLVRILSSGCSPVCNLAQDNDTGWDHSWGKV